MQAFLYFNKLPKTFLWSCIWLVWNHPVCQLYRLRLKYCLYSGYNLETILQWIDARGNIILFTFFSLHFWYNGIFFAFHIEFPFRKLIMLGSKIFYNRIMPQASRERLFVVRRREPFWVFLTTRTTPIHGCTLSQWFATLYC